MQLSNAQVHVGTEDGVEREKTKAHLAFEVDNLLELRTAIERRGLRILEGLPVPGCERFEFRDPFGNRVEIVQRNAD